MGKRVIVERGTCRVFADLKEAAEALGVSDVTVSRRLSAGDGLFWHERIYAVKTKDGCWRIAHRGQCDRGWRTIDEQVKRFNGRDVSDVREITGEWYQKIIKEW